MPVAKIATMQVILMFIVHHFKTTEAICQTGCEKVRGKTPIWDSNTFRALVRHSFKNFTVNKPFNCFVKCSHERCRCQAFQIKGESRCELLDKDRFAAPDDVFEELGY